MFHEVSPIFIQNTMLGVLMVKLNEPLDSFPQVEFYTRGECVPEKEDEKIISILREKAITELHKLKPKKMPLRYIPLEMAFQRIAKEQRKLVMSKEECFEVAATYNFTRESFNAALKYLHGLKLIFYYEEVLPNIMFINAQAILDKITKLVVHSLSSQAKSSDNLLGALKQFVKRGIVTAEILEQFSSHYVPKLFSGKTTGCVTITGPFSSYFHVIVELEPPEDASADGIQQIYEEICPSIRETILTGIRKASQKLNYNDSIPEISFNMQYYVIIKCFKVA